MVEICTVIEVAKIKKVMLFNRNDFVYDDEGNIVRMKRKYGKFKRDVVVIMHPFED